MLSRNVAALCLAGLALAGCSSGSDPAPVTLPSLTATPTPTATVEPVPSAATPLTPQGADAFVRYFFDQMNVAFRTSNASIIDALSTPACITCNNYESSLRTRKAAGKFVDGDSFTVKDVAAAPPEVKGTTVDVIGKIPARNSVDAQGKVLERFPAESRFYFVATLQRLRNAWVVVDLSNAAR